MEMLNFHFFVLTLALVGAVIIIAALLPDLSTAAIYPKSGSSWRWARCSARRDWRCWTLLWNHQSFVW
jgi:hypothetical protein